MNPLLKDLSGILPWSKDDLSDIDRRWLYILAFALTAFLCLWVHLYSGLKEGFISWWYQVRSEFK